MSRATYLAACLAAASLGVTVVDSGEAIMIGPDPVDDFHEPLREVVKDHPSNPEEKRLKRLAKRVNKK